MEVEENKPIAETPATTPQLSAADVLLGIHPEYQTFVDNKMKAINPSDQVNWNVVRLIIEKYTERNYEEIIGCFEYVKQLKLAAKDKKYGQVTLGEDGSQMRHLMEIPDRLETALTMKYPLIFKDKNLRMFFELYPVFFIPEKL